MLGSSKKGRKSFPHSPQKNSQFLNLFFGLKQHAPNVPQKRDIIDPESGIVEYDESYLDRISKIVATTLSSIIPILAILVLYFIKSTSQRIYIMIGFTAVFAAALTTFTSARRIEIFASTAT
jgi:hypothetical protein